MRVVMTGTLLVLLIFSCRKNPPGEILPAYTNSGKHTLGCFVNGEAWLPYDRGNHEQYELPKPSLSENGGLKISATRIDDKKSSRNWFCIEIYQGCLEEGIYPLSNRDCTSPYQTFYYGSNAGKSGEIYRLDTLSPHFIEITHLDEQKKIIAGKFEFTAISQNQDSIRVRLGRFDLNYD